MTELADIFEEEQFCKELAERLNITYIKLPKDHGRYRVDTAASIFDEIRMCDYTSVDIYLVCFYHELGHILVTRDNVSFLSKFERELHAWKYGLRELEKSYNVTYEMVNFMLDALLTYVWATETYK